VALVITYGNPLRRDDSVGWYIAEWLRAANAPGLDVVSCHQLTPELAAQIARATCVIFVDAAEGTAPGQVECRPVRGESDEPLASHSLSPARLIQLARDLYGGSASAWCVAVVGHEFGHGAELSPVVQRSVAAAGQQILRLVKADTPREVNSGLAARADE
jgi:hydrogenase maturation protease